jgi:hypothetical protein
MWLALPCRIYGGNRQVFLSFRIAASVLQGYSLSIFHHRCRCLWGLSGFLLSIPEKAKPFAR